MHPYKGDNGCWLFGTDSSAVTAEENKLRGCSNPTFLVIRVFLFFLIPFGYFMSGWSVHWQNSLGMDISKGEKKSFINNWWSLEWHEKMMTASERMGGRDYFWFSGIESLHNLAWMASYELPCIVVLDWAQICVETGRQYFFCKTELKMFSTKIPASFHLFLFIEIRGHSQDLTIFICSFVIVNNIVFQEKIWSVVRHRSIAEDQMPPECNTVLQTSTPLWQVWMCDCGVKTQLEISSILKGESGVQEHKKIDRKTYFHSPDFSDFLQIPFLVYLF